MQTCTDFKSMPKLYNKCFITLINPNVLPSDTLDLLMLMIKIKFLKLNKTKYEHMVEEIHTFWLRNHRDLFFYRS